MRILIAAHRKLNDQPRGGEISVSLIRDHLKKNHQVRTILYSHPRLGKEIKRADLVLTWGLAARPAFEYCTRFGVPFILMVRWWRNLLPEPWLKAPGDMMTRPIQKGFQRLNQIMFDEALGVVTNNEYAADVVERFYGRRPIVSKVPVSCEIEQLGSKDGPILLVTDHRNLGEPALIRALAARLPERTFLVVNARHEYRAPNVYALAYLDDMDAAFEGAAMVLCPMYGNDTCGHGRVPVEAMFKGIPALGNDRAGFGECGAELVSRGADAAEWVQAIERITAGWDVFSEGAHQAATDYDTAAQLAVYDEIIAHKFERVDAAHLG